MAHDRIEQMAEDMRYVRGRVDELHGILGDHRVDVEGRVSRLETKAGLWGVLGGLLGTIILHLKGR